MKTASLLLVCILLIFCGIPLCSQKPALPNNGRAYKASELGAVLDCDLATGAKIGGGTATNNTAVLQGYLNTASALHPVHLIIDGPALITGLKIAAAGYTTIEGFGPDTGFFMKAGSNSSAIESVNAPGMVAATDSEIVSPGVAPTRGANVQLRNFQVNGNRGTFTSGAYNRDGNSSGVMYQGNPNYAFNIHLANLNHIRIENIWSINSPAWNIRLPNVGDVVVRDSYIHEDNGYAGGTPNWNGDGLNVVGPSNDIRGDNNVFDQLGDDGLVLNAQGATTGTISRVTVTNSIFNNTTSIVRLYAYYSATRNGSIDNVSISNCVGSASRDGIIADYDESTGASSTDWIRHVSISNVRLTSPSFLDIQKASLGDVEISNSVWIPTGANPAIYFRNNPATVGTLTLNNFTIYRDASGSSAGSLIGLQSTSTIGRLNLNGVRVANAIGGSTAAIASAIDVPTGAILTRLWVDSLDPTLITSVLSASGSTNIGSIQGPGLSAAGLTAK